MKLVLCVLIVLSTPQFLVAAQDSRTYTLVTFEQLDEVPAYKEATEFIEDVLKESHLKINVIKAPVIRGLQIVDSGQADFFIAASPSAPTGFKNLTVTSFPYLKSHLSVFFHKDSEGFKKGVPLSELVGVTLLNSPKVFLDTAKRDLKMTGVSSVNQGLKMILAKRADFLLANKAVVQGIIEASPREYEKIGVQEKSTYEQDLHFVVNKKNKLLLPLIETKIKEALKSKLSGKYKYINSILNVDI